MNKRKFGRAFASRTLMLPWNACFEQSFNLKLMGCFIMLKKSQRKLFTLSHVLVYMFIKEHRDERKMEQLQQPGGRR